jgi:uncharacterized protein with beta-barrel porin domain
MKQRVVSYRITRIAKTTVAVAVCGFFSSTGGFGSAALAQSSSPTDLSVSSTATIVGGSGQAFDVVYNLSNNVSNTYSGNITLTLGSGANLDGTNVTGATGQFAVFTRDIADTSIANNQSLYRIDSVSFSDANVNSTLILNGGNTITGLVGVKPIRQSDSLLSDTYNGGVTADPLDLILINGSAPIIFGGQVFARSIQISVGTADLTFNGHVGNTTYRSELDINGQNAAITLGSGSNFYGSILNSGVSDPVSGSLTLSGNNQVTGAIGNSTSGLQLIRVFGTDGLGNHVLGTNSTTNVTTRQLDYCASSNVTVLGSLILNLQPPDVNITGVTFNNWNGTLNIAGDIQGRENEAVVSSTTNNTGTVTFFGTTQTVTGDLGSIGGKSLRRVNVGAEAEDGLSNVSVLGDIHATQIVLNQNASAGNSVLTIGAGHSIVATVNTSSNTSGILQMAGGLQSVTGQVGSSTSFLSDVRSAANNSTTTFTGDVFSINVTNTGNGTSIFQSSVTAETINVGTGTSNFSASVAADTTVIGNSGTANFLSNSSAPVTNLSFDGIGTANLHAGLEGSIDFGNQTDATVNLWNGMNITGPISTPGNGTAGILNVRGGGNLLSTVGDTDWSIKALNIGTSEANQTLVANGSIFAETIRFSGSNNGTLLLDNNVNLTGTVLTGTNATGNILVSGDSTIDGPVGNTTHRLSLIEAGAQNSVVSFNNGTVYANTLRYTGDNSVVILGGLNPLVSEYDGANFTNASDLGFVGTIDFNNSSSELHIADNVDLITSGDANTTTSFRNANDAELHFLGNSTVTGNLGDANNTLNQNFHTVYAGVSNTTVTFRGDVFVGGETLNVTENGVVNLLGNLSGPVVYAANGSINVADGKTIFGDVQVAQGNENNGTLNFVGSTTTGGEIGTNTSGLLAVNFHHVSSDDVILPVNNAALATVNIGHNIYALDTTIGINTTATITRSVNLGTNLTLAGDTVTLNTAGDTNTSSTVSPVDFAHTKLANGTLLLGANITQSTISDGGTITTNNATLNFALQPQAWNATDGGGLISGSESSSITGGTGTKLILSGGERVNLSLLGSLRHGEEHDLIVVDGEDSSGNTFNISDLNLRDNSFVINSTITRTNPDSGGIRVTFSRSDDVYVTLSNTSGHFSNPAAERLGTLAASGMNYTADMQTALNILDIDQWGFGNNEENLARQVKRLAPIANNSNGFAAFKTASAVSDSLGLRMHEMRIPEKDTLPGALWLKTAVQSGKHQAVGEYDGFETDINLITLGADKRLSSDSLLGIAASYSTTKVDQRDFRAGEDASIAAYHLSLYGAVDLTDRLFFDSTLSGSWLETKGNRATISGRTAQYDIDGDQVTAKLSMGYRIPVMGINATLTPIVSYEASSLKQDTYAETGTSGDVGLNVNAETLTRSQAAFGLRFSSTHLIGGFVVKPDLAVYATKDSGNFTKPIVAQYIGDTSGTTFTTMAARKSLYDLSGTRATLGLSVLMSKYSSMNVRYEHQKNDNFKSNSLDVLVRWDFY